MPGAIPRTQIMLLLSFWGFFLSPCWLWSFHRSPCYSELFPILPILTLEAQGLPMMPAPLVTAQGPPLHPLKPPHNSRPLNFLQIVTMNLFFSLPLSFQPFHQFLLYMVNKSFLALFPPHPLSPRDLPVTSWGWRSCG